MFGFINLNKPAGFTSHDCIAKLRKLLNTRKIGHGGTLDPAARGVLPVAVGKATRLLKFLPEFKSYRAQIRLGITTTTDDLAGEIIKSADTSDLQTDRIITSLNSFIGTIEQIPPIYSALKKDGKKLYELARKGQEVAIEPRTINVYKIELIDFNQSEFCDLEINIECGPGTYIRAIARDLGEMLGVGGTLANLIRTESCGMQLDRSITFEQIASQLEENTFSLIEPSQALRHLSNVTLADNAAKRWCQGQLVDLSEAIAKSSNFSSNENDYLVTYLEDSTFLGISIAIERNDILKIKPKIVCANH
ncbi:MAG: tRNA pseudouridine(55) synthase TruB [Pleurocapsa sp. MO_226.B13]|nr:tRNA pseudouridine(55) synthase TruB [Pleurocapsa sp. MO_226.B13]